MRIDKFLKVSRILKRRSVAAAACGGERVFVNGRAVKPAHRVKVGDCVRVEFGGGALEFTVKSLDEKAGKEEADKLYELRNT
ncbi:MAG: RNA-binding S4 domain-containing protein [Clostridiales bacterium]|jgi:ribosomal 50S subunit-recycling heat shock protein|nr:RNA-binding S4 domain-containing protein [Clostridiales bacterium]